MAFVLKKADGTKLVTKEKKYDKEKGFKNKSKIVPFNEELKIN